MKAFQSRRTLCTAIATKDMRLAGGSQGFGATPVSVGVRSFQARIVLKSVVNSPWFCHLYQGFVA